MLFVLYLMSKLMLDKDKHYRRTSFHSESCLWFNQELITIMNAGVVTTANSCQCKDHIKA